MVPQGAVASLLRIQDFGYSKNSSQLEEEYSMKTCSLQFVYICLYLTLSSLTGMLNVTGYGYNCPCKATNHLFCLNDLKLYVANDEQLEALLQAAQRFTKEVNMKFGL